ncbi:MAG: HPF/RaiA family ribosome-associated protein [Bacteroidales bacterium]|nr:HPF/RaiA family ribosome-associated protein [Candidatus Colicola faecequi]
MRVNVQAVNFEMAQKLEQFIQKKTDRFSKHLSENDEIIVKMTVDKPATAHNKTTSVRIGDLFAEKTADTFEDGLHECLDALERQIERRDAK